MSKITRRQFLKRAAAFTGGAALSATPTGSLITFGKTFQQVAPITILINDSPWFPGFEAIVKLYQQETGNKVNLSVLPFAGMLDKSRNAVQGKQSEFDILNLNEQWYMPFYANGWVAPIKKIDPDFKLDPEVIEYDYATRWDPKLKYSSKEGELYGLPINGNIQLFFYRKDLYEKAGLKAPATWDEVEANAKALHNPPNVYGYALRTKPPNFEFQAYLETYGANIVSLDEKTGEWSIGLTSKGALDALNTWLRLGKTYGPPNLADLGQAENTALMSSGKLAQMHAVCAVAPNFQNPKNSVVVDKVAASVVPGVGDKRVTMSGIWVMGIPSNVPAERQQAALTFLKWALTKKTQLEYTKAGAIPVRQDVYQELSADPKFWWTKAMADSTQYIKAQPRLVETAQLVEIIDRRVVEALTGKQTPENALKEAAKEVEAILKAGGYKYKPLA